MSSHEDKIEEVDWKNKKHLQNAFDTGLASGPDAGIDALGFNSFLSQFTGFINKVKMELLNPRKLTIEPQEPILAIDPTNIDDLKKLIEITGEVFLPGYTDLKVNLTLARLSNFLDNFAPILPFKRQMARIEIEKGEKSAIESFLPESAHTVLMSSLKSFYHNKTDADLYYIHEAGMYYMTADGKPDLEKRKKLNHPHFFFVHSKNDTEFELYFVDPEFMLADRTTRPPVTNLIGVHLFADDYEKTKLTSVRYHTPKDTRKYQKSILQHGLIKHIVDPIKNVLPKALEAAGLTRSGIDILTSFSVKQDSVELISKFTPTTIMERVIKNQDPGPEISNQITATLLVLGGLVTLLVDENKQHNWKSLPTYFSRSKFHSLTTEK